MKEGRAVLTLEEGRALTPLELRDAVRKADFTPTWVRVTARGRVTAFDASMTVTIPGEFLGGDESDREVPTSGLALEIPGFEKPVVLLQSPEGGGLELGVVTRMTGTLFSAEELVGVAVGWRDVVFLLPEARPPPE